MTSKVILITGCSSGLGRHMAVYLSQYHTVIATMRTIDQSLSDLFSCDVQCLDVVSDSSISSMMDYIADTYGRLDVLINNAGYAVAGFFEELSEQKIRSQFDTNFFGLQAVTRACLPIMRQQRSGQIINISSVAGRSAIPGLGAYNASKWAVEGFSESLRFELRPFGISVNLIEPGPFKTNIFSKNVDVSISGSDSAYFTQFRWFESKFKQLMASMPDDLSPVTMAVNSVINGGFSAPFRIVVGRQAKLRVFLRDSLPFRIYEIMVRFLMR